MFSRAILIGFWIWASAAGIGNAAEPRLAIKGLDPVALVEGRELAGAPEITVTHGRFRYQFADAANRGKFEKSPEQYTIQYGGACGKMGLLSGQGDPSRFFVFDRKIYIFASEMCRDAFKKAPEKYLDRDDPNPTGTQEQKVQGKKLLDMAARTFGAGIDEIKSLRKETRLTYAAANQETIGTKVETVQFPLALRHDESYGKSGYRLVCSPAGHFTHDAKGTWELESREQLALRRQMLRDPLLQARLRNEPGFVAIYVGSTKVGDIDCELVRTAYQGVVTDLLIDPTSGKVLELQFTGRASSGDAPFKWTFDDFCPENELVIPRTYRIHVNGKLVANPKIQVSRLEVNPILPDGTFRKPG